MGGIVSSDRSVLGLRRVDDATNCYVLCGFSDCWHRASCDAAFVFSNVSYTSNSLTFTINGDMSGYSAPTSGDPFFTGNDQFSIRYNGGDIWAGVGGFTANSWSTSVFDNKSFNFVGNTGTFGGITPEYTWSQYTSNLSNAVATNRTVTVTFGANYLFTGAANPIVEFYWGNGSANFFGVNKLADASRNRACIFWCASTGTCLTGVLGPRCCWSPYRSPKA